jgi:hypothetical protein
MPESASRSSDVAVYSLAAVQEAQDNVRQATVEVNGKMVSLQIKVLEMAGKIEFHLQDTKIHLAQIRKLQSENQALADEIVGLKAKLRLAHIGLDATRIIEETVNRKEKN